MLVLGLWEFWQSCILLSSIWTILAANHKTIIKEAEKGRPLPKSSFAATFWRPLFMKNIDKDLTFINQNIVKNTINNLQELPAKSLTITTLTNLCILFYLQSTNLTT